jgi:very-short-patch-repair endonuclease
MPMKLPKPLSQGEELLAQHLTAYGIEFRREVTWYPERKWRADFYFMAKGGKEVLVEVEGGTSFGRSRHSKGRGFEDDCRKYNTASSMGFVILRFSTEMVNSAEAIDFIREMFA